MLNYGVINETCNTQGSNTLISSSIVGELICFCSIFARLILGATPNYLTIINKLKIMLVTKQIEIDMGHRVPNHKSKCKNLHGHRYVIEVGVDDKVIDTAGTSDEGMVIDFGDLKEIMLYHIDKVYDHSMTLFKDDEFANRVGEFGLKTNFVDFIPTAENLAQHWFFILKKELEELNIRIKYVKVWETPTSSATYYE